MRVTEYKTRLTDKGRVVLEKEVSVYCPDLDRRLNSPDKVEKFARQYLRMHELPEEYMYLVCLNNKLEFTGVFELSHGNVNSSIVGMRELFQKALLANAVSIVLMHNHPSGDPTPSREDIKVTERAVEAGRLLGVEVIDHLIVGKPGYVSLREKGYI